MIRFEVAGAIGADGLPGAPGQAGPYVATTWQDVRTESGTLPAVEALLYPRLGAPGVVAGQGHGTGIAWLHQPGGWTHAGTTFGVNPVIFDAGGTLVLATIAQGSQGYRYVADDGRLVTGDESINSRTALAQSYGLHGFWEWTRQGDVTIGQGEAYCLTEGPHGRRVLEPGGCYDIRFTRRGTSCAVAMIKREEGKAVFLWFEDHELAGLPLEGTPPIEPPIEPPVEPPIEDLMHPPQVTVDRWTLSDVLDGREFVFHDGGNPDLQIAARVWVEGGVMYASLTNKHGTARTGARRPVEPCSQHPPDPVDPPDPPDPVDPPAPSDRIFLQTVHGSYLAVGSDAFLTTSSTAVAAFTVEPQGNGRHGLKVQGKYVACEPDGRLEANRDTCSEWEYVTVHEDEAGGLAFQAWTGLFISVADSGSVLANQSVIGGWETFTPSPAPPVGVGRPPITGPLSAGSGRIFYAHGGAAWRYCGVSAFPLCRRYTDGGAAAVQPFLDAFPEYTVLRVWDYVPWPGTGWASCSVEEWQAFLAFVKAQGWYVELTLLTDDDPQRLGWAEQLVRGLAGTANLLIEIGNEPETNKSINTRALERACNESGLLYSSGNYEVSEHWFGRFGTAHTARDSEWPRKGHDLMEYYGGGGPHAPTDPACPAPWVGDEPIRPDQCNPNWWPIEQDYQSHGAVCALLGAGCTFHFAGGRFGTLPTELEQRCAAAMIGGLTAFPPDAPNWGYARIDEEGNSLRTYVLGDRCMVRVRPTTPEAPQPGWRALDGWHQLFVR